MREISPLRFDSSLGYRSFCWTIPFCYLRFLNSLHPSISVTYAGFGFSFGSDSKLYYTKAQKQIKIIVFLVSIW